MTQMNSHENKKYSNTAVFLDQLVTVYTIMAVLSQMKGNLGLEAMLQYIENTMRKLESHNPKLRESVCYALTRVKIEKIYKDASFDENNNCKT